MQLIDYFNFLAPNYILLKGTRVGIETILYDFIYKSKTPEEIAQTYSSVTWEQVYATILYYLFVLFICIIYTIENQLVNIWLIGWSGADRCEKNSAKIFPRWCIDEN